jgi:nucleotide-binding universal stress UspA family protein
MDGWMETAFPIPQPLAPLSLSLSLTLSLSLSLFSTVQDPVAYEQLIKNAEAFIAARFLPRLAPIRPDPVIHIIKSEVDADSVGNVVCAKAGSLGAAALVMASHSKSKLAELFLGSVTNYCTHHAPVPVLVVK